MRPPEVIAAQERLNEAKCAAELAKRKADEAVELCQVREIAYEVACRKLREVEREFEAISLGRWRLWKVF